VVKHNLVGKFEGLSALRRTGDTSPMAQHRLVITSAPEHLRCHSTWPTNFCCNT